MKRIFVVFAALLTFAAVANAQISYGVKVGSELSNVKVGVDGLSATFSPGIEPGFYGGGVLSFDINRTFAIQTELLYSFGGMRLDMNDDFASSVADAYNASTSDGSLVLKHMWARANFHTLRLPVLAKLKTSDGLNIVAGPYVQYRLGASVSYNDALSMLVGNALSAPFTEKDLLEAIGTVVHKNLKPLDAGVVLGLEYGFTNGLFVEARYTIGLLNSLKKDIDYTDLYNLGREEATQATEPVMIENYSEKIYGLTPYIKNSSLQVGFGFRF